MRGVHGTAEHGTLSCYTNGCRRAECRAAMTAYHREWRQARRAAQAPPAAKRIKDCAELVAYEAADGDYLLAIAYAAEWVRLGHMVADKRGLSVTA